MRGGSSRSRVGGGSCDWRVVGEFRNHLAVVCVFTAEFPDKKSQQRSGAGNKHNKFVTDEWVEGPQFCGGVMPAFDGRGSLRMLLDACLKFLTFGHAELLPLFLLQGDQLIVQASEFDFPGDTQYPCPP